MLKNNFKKMNNDFLKSIGVPSIRNENEQLPYDVKDNIRYLRNKVAIEKIKADETSSNRRKI